MLFRSGHPEGAPPERRLRGGDRRAAQGHHSRALADGGAGGCAQGSRAPGEDDALFSRGHGGAHLPGLDDPSALGQTHARQPRPRARQRDPGGRPLQPQKDQGSRSGAPRRLHTNDKDASISALEYSS